MGPRYGERETAEFLCVYDEHLKETEFSLHPSEKIIDKTSRYLHELWEEIVFI